MRAASRRRPVETPPYSAAPLPLAELELSRRADYWRTFDETIMIIAHCHTPPARGRKFRHTCW